jgi:pimeloyl-ACP methyl ester carboxylesterase
MTVVLVHGNPETDAVWDPLVELLGRDDVVRLNNRVLTELRHRHS